MSSQDTDEKTSSTMVPPTPAGRSSVTLPAVTTVSNEQQQQLSSSGLPQLDQPLDRLLGEIAKQIRNAADANIRLYAIYLEATVSLKQLASNSETSLRITHELRLDVLNTMDVQRRQAMAFQDLTGTISDSKQAVNESRSDLKKIQADITGVQQTLKVVEEEEIELKRSLMPRWYRGVILQIGEMSWKHKFKLISWTVVGTTAWLKALPHLIEAAKLFWRGT